MQINENQRAFFVEKIMQVFGRSKEDALWTVTGLEALLQGENEDVLYELQYKIFKENNPEYTQRLVRFLFEGYTYLHDSMENATAQDRERMKKGVGKLLDFLFVERCIYAKQIERQSIAAQHILKSISDQLNDVLQTQERMIASLSHEMRTSLNAVTGYLNILEESKMLRGEEKFHLKKAMHGATSLQALVKDILSITKINSGQLEIRKDFFDIDEMLLECIDHISIEIRNRQSIEFGFESEFFPMNVYGDRMHIMEILINFLTNAYKYTESGFVKLSVEFEEEKDTFVAVFRVSDSGIGMTQEQIEGIFSPYSRYQKEKQGLGLGLHITKHLAQKLGGELEVQSTYGEGSVFSFRCRFEKFSEKVLSFDKKRICFYADESFSGKNFVKKVDFLRKNGIEVEVFQKESDFINYLLNVKKNIPDIISVMAQQEFYTKVDALIYYLHSAKYFGHTVFIAENMHQHLSLKYFDELYEYCAPMSRYEKLLEGDSLLDSSKEKLELSVLVVDDTETNLEIFKLYMQRRYPNVTVDIAEGGYEAIGICRVKSYNVIFLDLKMPGMDGFKVIKKLRDECSVSAPVYAFSADVYKATYDKTAAYGFAGVLEKPLNVEILYNIIGGLLRGKIH